MELCGFLAPDGTFTECPSFAHMSTAQDITEKVYNREFYFGLQAEDFLYEQGYVGFYARSANHNWIVNDKICLLTDAQIDFIINNMSKAFNDEQAEAIKELLEWNDCYKEDSILHHYENKIQ